MEAEVQRAWHLAMADQDVHEVFECPPCRQSETPVCAEGKRLHQIAREAHEAWVIARYGSEVAA